MADTETLCHATCVALNGDGVLLCGDSGFGKSDLALRLMDAGFVLAADDTVLLRHENGVLKADVPETVAGLLEIRGLGIVSVPFVRNVSVKLKVCLSPFEKPDRMPENETEMLCGVRIPVFRVNAFEVSAAAKVRYALAVATGKIKVKT